MIDCAIVTHPDDDHIGGYVHMLEDMRDGKLKDFLFNSFWVNDPTKHEFEPEDVENPLGEFLTQVSLVSDIDGLDEIANNVTLMTLHASKGLEFPIIYLAGCDEGIFPSGLSIHNLC